MKLIFIFGNSSVGKMSVGQQLCKITNLRLFHNHMSIEPVIEIFGRYDATVISQLRDVVFANFARSDNYGMVFTYMWDFDRQADWDYIEHVKQLFLSNNPDTVFYYVELVATQEARLQRNGTANRLTHKPSKRDIEQSNKRLLDGDKKYRCESRAGEIPFDNYMLIDNTHLNEQQTALRIKERFDLS